MFCVTSTTCAVRVLLLHVPLGLIGGEAGVQPQAKRCCSGGVFALNETSVPLSTTQLMLFPVWIHPEPLSETEVCDIEPVTLVLAVTVNYRI